jgi:hypothetical protein
MSDEQAQSKAAGYAFPSILNIHGLQYEQTGITIRALLAGMAMQGMCANPNFSTTRMQLVAQMAVMQADYMIEELEKEVSHDRQ